REYTFQHPEAPEERGMNAVAALVTYQKTGKSPLSKWQTHLFVFRPKPLDKSFLVANVLTERSRVMPEATLMIRLYAGSDEARVIRLWREVFPDNPPWDEPVA